MPFIEEDRGFLLVWNLTLPQCLREEPMEDCLMGVKLYSPTHAGQNVNRRGRCVTPLVAPPTNGHVLVMGTQASGEDLPEKVRGYSPPRFSVLKSCACHSSLTARP